MATTPPKCTNNVTMKHRKKAAPAVINHPPITEITPVTRNTALSRPHARSANDEPMPTINATYVVDNGSFREVPTTINKPANTKFTEARTKSNAAPFGIIASS